MLPRRSSMKNNVRVHESAGRLSTGWGEGKVSRDCQGLESQRSMGGGPGRAGGVAFLVALFSDVAGRRVQRSARREKVRVSRKRSGRLGQPQPGGFQLPFSFVLLRCISKGREVQTVEPRSCRIRSL